MMTVNDVYLEVCDAILEPGGMVLGLVTPEAFLEWFGETITDILTKCGIVKKIVCLGVDAGIGTYTLPNAISDTQYAAYDQGYLYQTSTFYLDNSNSIWAGTNNDPTTWKQDEIGTKEILLSPTPTLSGDPVTMLLGQGMFGQIAAVSNTNDLNILGPSTGMFGAINGFTGAPYLEVVTPMWGTIASMSVSVTNLETISTAIPSKVTGWQLTDTIELLPDSFSVYLKYGILARLFSQDGEQKDEFKAMYCASRLTEGINLMAAIMSESFEQEN